MTRHLLGLAGAVAVATFLLSIAPACSSSPAVEEPAPICLDAGVDESCTPAFAPTWPELYASTFSRSCAAPGVSCHASTGRQGGIDFGSEEAAYASLTNGKVRPGEPACSSLVQRVVATDGKVRMPPGRSLPAGEQCAIIQWVAAGAKR